MSASSTTPDPRHRRMLHAPPVAQARLGLNSIIPPTPRLAVAPTYCPPTYSTICAPAQTALQRAHARPCPQACRRPPRTRRPLDFTGVRLGLRGTVAFFRG